jgi:hypothetical protein
VAICLLAVFHPGISLQAAPVTFSNPVTVRDEHDVLTSGALDRAIGFGGSDQTVNGVTFNAGKADGGQQTVDYGATILTASPDSIVALGDSPTFGGDGEPANSLPKPYRDLLAAGAYNNTTKGTLTVTLAGLAAGTSYTAQFFINDSRDFHGGGRSATVSSEGATSQALRFSNTGAAGGVGQYVTATFTADHTTQDFVIAPLRPGIDDAQINCLQLRSNAPGSPKSSARPQANPVRPKLD